MALTFIALVDDLECFEYVLGECDGLLDVECRGQLLVYLIRLELPNKVQDTQESVSLQLDIIGFEGRVV